MSTEPQTYLHTYGDRVIVCETDTGRVVCGFDMSELLAIAAEKEAQTTYTYPTDKWPVCGLPVKAQHHTEQHLEMVAQAEVPLPHHPEPHTHCWTKLEIEAIKQHREAYAKAAVAEAVAVERERLCCAIKVTDDLAMSDGYALDSEDCIKVIRGTWVFEPLPLPKETL